MSNKNCLPLSIYKQGRTWQILHHNATLKTRVPCNFIHIRNFFTNENSFYSLVSITERQRQRKYIHSTLMIYYTYASGKIDERKVERKGRKVNCSKKTRLEIAMGQSRSALSMSLKAFSTIFYNFPLKISVHSNYLLLKISKRTRTDMNEYSNE